MSSKTRILICDDHTLFVEGIKALLRNERSLEVVGEARDGRQAVDLVKELQPDLLLMDVSDAGYVRNSRLRPYDRLSAREREVLKLLAEGLSVKEVATRLGLSVKTVDVHKYNLMKKIDVHDRAELIKYAIKKKLIAV